MDNEKEIEEEVTAAKEVRKQGRLPFTTEEAIERQNARKRINILSSKSELNDEEKNELFSLNKLLAPKKFKKGYIPKQLNKLNKKKIVVYNSHINKGDNDLIQKVLEQVKDCKTFDYIHMEK